MERIAASSLVSPKYLTSLQRMRRETDDIAVLTGNTTPNFAVGKEISALIKSPRVGFEKLQKMK